MSDYEPEVFQVLESIVTCVECPSCCFAFDADYVDEDGGHACPVCTAPQEAEDLARALEEDGAEGKAVWEKLRAYRDAFPRRP